MGANGLLLGHHDGCFFDGRDGPSLLDDDEDDDNGDDDDVNCL